LTIAWNLIEAAIAIAAGAIAGSVALVGFGVDSLIESSSGAVLLWRLRAERRGMGTEMIERRALRLVGVSFLLLAAYVGYESAERLISQEAPATSLVGIILAIASLVVMPWLARAKRNSAAALNSSALHADSRQTSICAYLSAILLAGLALNSAFGWWWADLIAAFAMVPIIAREGLEALRGDPCHC
jgi:divalent metal cation (Fe/Co/Zn/Cd) transporter